MNLLNNNFPTLFFNQISFNCSDIKIFNKGNLLLVKGPLGLLTLTIPEMVTVKRVGSKLIVCGTLFQKALILTFFKLLIQTLRGVEFGFFDILLIKGIGWRVSLEQSTLVFALGYSHLVKYLLPKGVEAIIFDKQKFKVFGLDLGKVRQVVSDLSHLRTLDVYKGKGVYSQTRLLILKVSSKSKS